MKNFVLALMLLSLAGFSQAQTADQKLSLGILGGKTEYKGDLGNGMFKCNPFYGHGALSLNYYLNSSFNIGLLGEYGAYGYKGLFTGKKSDLSLLLTYKFNNGYLIKEDAVIQPYLAAGAGIAKYSGDRINESDMDELLPVGGGIKVKITPAVAIQYQALYNFTDADKRDNVEINRDDDFLSHTIGLIFTFGAPKDEDKDLIPDKLDKCPGTPAGVKVTLDGCPVDGDKDGVPDYLDKCPSEAGIAQFAGCPDTDGDGVQDSEDNCPRVKGLASLKGCPDSDGDGVPDSADKCPMVSGLASLNGCPDKDGDGITDSEDRCPDAKGSVEMKGCPDGDNDGVPDIDDKCPTVFGLAANKGCPEVKQETLKVFTQALTGILFESGKDVIKSSSFGILDNIVNIMKENPAYNLTINGHTDNVGDDAKNLDLSKKRANAVKKYLTDKGVQPERMTAEGFGETIPVADNNTAAGRAKNRRVEFKVVF